jgi:hypothetical protein
MALPPDFGAAVNAAVDRWAEMQLAELRAIRVHLEAMRAELRKGRGA